MQHFDEYREVVEGFADASPELLARRKLLRRTDTKFVFGAEELPQLLGPLQPSYRVLRANGQSVATYRTLYFDTPEMRCFHDHRRGCRPRHKVRFRHYVDREVTFLEVKTKRSELQTKKKRKEHPYGSTALDESDLAFIAQHCDVSADALAPKIWTNFRRVTLIGEETAERITIDTHLELEHDGVCEKLWSIAIVEVKQSPFSARTPAMLQLRRAGHRKVSASKYCTGNALLRPSLRMNRLLPALRLIKGLHP